MDTGIARSKVGGTEGQGITAPGSFCLPTMYRSHYSIYRATIADLLRAISASRPDSFRKTGESGSRKSIGTDPDNIEMIIMISMHARSIKKEAWMRTGEMP